MISAGVSACNLIMKAKCAPTINKTINTRQSFFLILKSRLKGEGSHFPDLELSTN